jgi:2-amino-4-hydroxy-6-hydroxymethyldihydropteridine diphosphokinase
VRAFVGLGSNLGDRHAHLARAVEGLPGVVGGPPGQGPYLNLVVELDTELGPRALLEVARKLEEDAGRRRGVRFGPRTLDVDVLLVGDLVVDDEDLIVPHPRMWERRFVVDPLAELAPELVPPEAREGAGGKVQVVGTL